MTYKITFKNHLKVLYGTLIFHIIFVSFFLFGIYYWGNLDGLFTQVFSFYYALSMVPTIFLHIEYYLRNKNDVVKIDPKRQFIAINEDKIICFNEIEKITLFMPPVWHRNSVIRMWPFEEYRYAKINLKNGDKYLFTCLMAFDVDKVMATISGVSIAKEVRLAATPLMN